MSDRPVEPPLSDELEEMTKVREREVVLLADVRRQKRIREQKRASEIVRMLDDGAA